VTSIVSKAQPNGDSETAPALQVINLTSGYHRTTILRDVTLEVGTGEAVALLGPNGAGKSTLLRTISGVLIPTAGSVNLFGLDVSKWPIHRRFQAGLCHIREKRGVFPSLTVRENLALQVERGKEDDAIERAIVAFPILGERLSQEASKLSGGQQQMLAMATAYTRNSRLVVIDEASLGLAPVVVDEIYAFIERLVADGTSLLIVDQFIERALKLTKRAYILRRGSVYYRGASSDLLHDDVFKRYIGET
jgi:branched-chain amino acid transport system ATP-binding protein